MPISGRMTLSHDRNTAVTSNVICALGWGPNTGLSCNDTEPNSTENAHAICQGPRHHTQSDKRPDAIMHEARGVIHNELKANRGEALTSGLSVCGNEKPNLQNGQRFTDLGFIHVIDF